MTLSPRLWIELQPRNAEGRVVPLISPLQVKDITADRQTCVTHWAQPETLKDVCFVAVLFSMGKFSLFKDEGVIYLSSILFILIRIA